MAHSVSLEIDPLSSRYGWMDCWLVVDGRYHRLDATSVFPPFGDVLSFAQAIAENRLPYEFIWDEEGHGAKFQAFPVASKPSCFRLFIDHDGEIVVDAEFDRMQIARGLLESLRRVALDCPGAESEWEFPYFLIEDFERALAQGFRKISTVGSVGVAHFVFHHYGGYGGGQVPGFSLWVEDRLAQIMPMNDSAGHWQAWFGLLETIRGGYLPAEAILQWEAEDPPGLFSLLGMDVVFHFQAEPIMESDHFRLKIIVRHPNIKPEIDQLVWEAIFDRQEFVSAFARAFKQFLKTDYLAFLESGTTQFDLCLLPIDRLIP
jgi:hypothetical protein